MDLSVTYTTVAAQPGWLLAIFSSDDGIDNVRYEHIVAWEIQRTTLPNGLVSRFPMPITAEGKNKDLVCTVWGLKRPDGKFVFPTGANDGTSEARLLRLARLMETDTLINKPTIASPSIACLDGAIVSPTVKSA